MIYCTAGLSLSRISHSLLTSELDASSWGMRSGHNEAVLKICRSSGRQKAETPSDNQAKWVCVYTSKRAQIAPRQLGKTEQMQRIRTRSGLCRKEYYFTTEKSQSYGHLTQYLTKLNTWIIAQFCIVIGIFRLCRRYPHLPLSSELDASAWGMRSGFWKMNFSEPHRDSLLIIMRQRALW